MRTLELLAPARNADIGIAAIDCGADAVYIAGPDFGARKDAGNPISEIARLCKYAHKFGARIYVTFNTLVREDEIEDLHDQMLQAQSAGADAFIVRDECIFSFRDIKVPLHASTQCAMRDIDRAREFIEAGCARVVLERQLPISEVEHICRECGAEVEVFVHGALCVCYSGVCTLSGELSSRSADRGECIQACRNLYDVQTPEGKVLVRNKAVLSLKDLNMIESLEQLCKAGVCSFKIEGRLKNESYVKNVVRAYRNALDSIIESNPGEYRKASFGVLEGGFKPDLDKTFNRGYTELYAHSQRGSWAAMDNPKSMGEMLGSIKSVNTLDGVNVLLEINTDKVLCNGDGLSVNTGKEICGFRADVCSGKTVRCKKVEGLKAGQIVWRNYNTSFEKELSSNSPIRTIPVSVNIERGEGLSLELKALSEDGRQACLTLSGETEAQNSERMASMLCEGLCKKASLYSFSLEGSFPQGPLPLLRSAEINSARRELAEILDSMPCKALPLANKEEHHPISVGTSRVPSEFMRTRYCLRNELGLCPKQDKSNSNGPLVLINNGRRFRLSFDCAKCEMALSPIEE